MSAQGAFPRSFFARDALEVAPELLNALIVRGACVARIVEVEAYRGRDDKASHAFRGPTLRNATMFGEPGRLYVYFTYGMHFCANVVCSPKGEASAVLLRALAPLEGIPIMRRRRSGVEKVRDLCSGPAKLCVALGIDRSFDGADLVGGERGITLVRDGLLPPREPNIGVRIGLSEGIGAARELPWRFAVPGDPNLSRVLKSPI